MLKVELEAKIVELEETIQELKAELSETQTRNDGSGLAETINSAPQFPGNYDDHVLVIEQGFKPAYQQFLARLKEHV